MIRVAQAEGVLAQDKGGYPTDEMLEIPLTWPLEPGEILTPISTPTEYNYRVRHEQAAKDAP